MTGRGRWLLRWLLPVLLGLGLLTSTASAASEGTAVPAGARVGPGKAPRVVHAQKHDVSRPLRELTPVFPGARPDPRARENETGARHEVAVPSLTDDPVLQTMAAEAAMPALSTSFDLLGNVNGYVPPDTNGDVGPNDYVESVNASFAIYSKSGTLEYGPASINTLWTGFGGLCESTNRGDPIVQYDSLADRWLISQLAFGVDFGG